MAWISSSRVSNSLTTTFFESLNLVSEMNSRPVHCSCASCGNIRCRPSLTMPIRSKLGLRVWSASEFALETVASIIMIDSDMHTLQMSPAATMEPADAPYILFLVSCGAYSLMAALTPAWYMHRKPQPANERLILEGSSVGLR
jgi:hypothetical protein